MISPSPTTPTMDQDHVKREFAVTNKLNPIFTSSNHSNTLFATQNTAGGGGSGTGSPISCTESTTPLADDDGQADEYINYNAEEEEEEEQQGYDEDEYFNSFPPGYRFKPHDEELVVYYLKRKIYNYALPRNRIKQVELYKYNPDTLAAQYKANGEDEWYFFTPRDRKYPNGDRPNRAAGDGFWKATGADKPIMFNGSKVGLKKSLVFYRGKPPRGDKTDWIMHEYKLIDAPKRRKVSQNDMKLDNWVLCKIRKKDKKDKSFKAASELQGQSSDASGLHSQSSDASPRSENVVSSSPCIPINAGLNTGIAINAGGNQGPRVNAGGNQGPGLVYPYNYNGAPGLVYPYNYNGAPESFHYDQDPMSAYAQQMNNIAIGSHNTFLPPWLDNASSPRIPFQHTMQTPYDYEYLNHVLPSHKLESFGFPTNDLDQLLRTITDEKDYKNI